MPGLSTVSPLKVAVPFPADTVVVPPRVAPPGLLRSRTETLPLNAVSTPPDGHSTAALNPNGLRDVTREGGWAVTWR